MAINFFVNRDSIYALFKKQIKGRRINLTYFPEIQINKGWNSDSLFISYLPKWLWTEVESNLT